MADTYNVFISWSGGEKVAAALYGSLKMMLQTARPWILFEAGALSKAMGERTRVCPYLFGGLRSEHVRLPLGMFQAARAEKEEARKLVFAVNRAIGRDR